MNKTYIISAKDNLSERSLNIYSTKVLIINSYISSSFLNMHLFNIFSGIKNKACQSISKIL